MVSGTGSKFFKNNDNTGINEDLFTINKISFDIRGTIIGNRKCLCYQGTIAINHRNPNITNNIEWRTREIILIGSIERIQRLKNPVGIRIKRSNKDVDTVLGCIICIGHSSMDMNIVLGL